jgi:hypothetical protein
MARFIEVLRCRGVDEDAIPPGMVVPLAGSNFVALTEGRGLRVVEHHRGIEINEVDPKLMRGIALTLNQALPHIEDKQASLALRPNLVTTDVRLFEIHGRHKVAFPGVLVQAISGHRTLAKLNVVVLDRVTINVAIRNLRVPDKSGNIVFHAKQPCDPIKEQDFMNRIWTPQTNIAFDLVSSEPALLDTREKGFKEEMAKELNVRDPITRDLAPHLVELAPEILPTPTAKILRNHVVPKAHITFFFVNAIKTSTGRTPNGVMSSSGIGFIASNRAVTTFAHEAGHFLGGKIENREWQNLHHTFDQDKDKPRGYDDVRYLMRDNGAGWKIPFKLVEQFRGFPTRHP